MTSPGKPLDLDGMEKIATEAAAMLRDPRGLSHDEMAKRFSDFMAATRPADVLALIQTQRELVGALKTLIAKWEGDDWITEQEAMLTIARAALNKALGEQPL